ncbi:ATP-binding protein [Streptomyces sp. ISL-36]|uniref:ATP-binding protein n=1 Tax=Streptomyces sp. ISL-36 TaxID=2819182 RepID=UPI001BE8BFA5|nr:ATP-binding protein [Streptomyces sp. ISL-36]MBT2444071.1 ATP-binding protein [Streptomyces sp. ISL-36]
MTAGDQRHASAYARRFALAGGPGVVGECRDLTRQAVRDWFGPAGDAESGPLQDVLLLVSEVVTNAYKHGGAPYELRLDRDDGRLRVQVSDSSPVPPRPHGPHRANRTSGHGLYLLERLSAAWGCVPQGTGKAVWFEVDVARAGAAASDAAARPPRA